MDYGGIFFEKNGGYRVYLLRFLSQVTSLCGHMIVSLVKGGFRPKVTYIFNDELNFAGY